MTVNQNPQHRPFCTAPFFHYYYKGDKRNTKMLPCCESRVDRKTPQTFDEYWNGDFLKEIRQSMMNGTPHDICTRCIEVETKGNFSARNHYANMIKNIENLVDEKIEYNVETGTQFETPLAMDYRGSNLCNLKCRMCHPGSSSELAKEIVKNLEAYEPFGLGAKNKLYKDNKEPNAFIETLPLHNIRRIKVLGGEPLMQEDVYIALERIGKQEHSKDVKISFTTNATNFPDRFIKLIGKFNKCLIRVSLDGTDDVYEYVRSNGNWTKVLDNCKKIGTYGFTKDKICLGFSFVVQFYNIFRIKDILTFVAEWENRQEEIWNMYPFFSTIEQDHLSTLLLTDEDRQYVNSLIDDFDKEYPNKGYTTTVRNIINKFDMDRKTNREEALKLMQDYTRIQDKIRDTDLKLLHERYGQYL